MHTGTVAKLQSGRCMACEASALKAAVSARKQNTRRRFFLESCSIRLCYVAPYVTAVFSAGQ
jgi:hypothetical protein